MDLVSRIIELANRIGLEIKTKIGANHQGLARAWVNFGYVNGQIVIRRSYNVGDVYRTSVGRYLVVFSNVMPDTDYCWTALARSSTNTGTQYTAVVCATTDFKTIGAVGISCATANGTFADSSEINLTVFH